MYKQFKLKKRKNRTKKTTLLLVVIFILFFYYFLFINPLIINNIEKEAHKSILNAMNYAIKNTANLMEIYEKMIKINHDESGNVTYIQTNIASINQVYSILSDKTQEYLNSNENASINLKSGILTGISFLSGVGNNIKIKIDSIERVKCDFNSNFKTTGINQTLHSIYVTINVGVEIVLPFKTISVSDQQQFLLCESVIVGKIPEVYLYSDNLDSLFNFVPID